VFNDWNFCFSAGMFDKAEAGQVTFEEFGRYVDRKDV
jgi:hypothetical protein